MGAEIRFTGEGIPVTEAARIMKKDQQFIRQAMIKGILPIGLAFRKEDSTQYDYYTQTSHLNKCLCTLKIQ